MNKNLFYLIGVAIAILISASSCEKDIYQKSPISETYFKIVDETHINTYDQEGILMEENREVSFSIKTQFDLVISEDTLRAAPDETLIRNFSYTVYEDARISDEDASLTVTFRYQNIGNKVKVYGVLQKMTNNAEDDYLFCMDEVILRAKIMPYSEEDGNIKVIYELKTRNLLLASAEQIFEVL